MGDFPVLKTGAVAQYPASKSVRFSTRVLSFLDGSEQRWREYGAPIRRWAIRLDLLDDSELTALEQFFVTQQGQLGDFSFTDPWDATEYLSCSLEVESVTLEHTEEGRSKTALVVKENRS